MPPKPKDRTARWKIQLNSHNNEGAVENGSLTMNTGGHNTRRRKKEDVGGNNNSNITAAELPMMTMVIVVVVIMIPKEINNKRSVKAAAHSLPHR